MLEEGKEIVYEKKQAQFSESTNTHQKIKGVAGSGKTVVLAKRAVNAHKRHGEPVLILTYNLTLRSYIHDRISDVRDGFSWGSFIITNYHQIISQTLNKLNIEIEIPENTPKHLVADFLDQKYYSNIDVFKSRKDEIHKYNSILIDEIQDYKPEWIKIIRSYFLEPDSEMVLFGDEKQNIYERDIDEDKNTKIVQGFGRWQRLSKSIRHKEDSHILKLAKSFQQQFFKERYDIDQYEENPIQLGLIGIGLNKVTTYSDDNLFGLVSTIFKNIKDENIHPNDVTVLCSKISVMREVDYIVRNNFNEKTITTFETKEMFESPNRREIDNIRKNKKIGFNLNNGLLKLSTIHSFKGFESPTVFLIIDENDHDEMIYVGITRAKFNIMIFLHQESKYKEFFVTSLENEL
jgi:superfamily I DNA and RNA helicase